MICSIRFVMAKSMTPIWDGSSHGNSTSQHCVEALTSTWSHLVIWTRNKTNTDETYHHLIFATKPLRLENLEIILKKILTSLLAITMQQAYLLSKPLVCGARASYPPAHHWPPQSEPTPPQLIATITLLKFPLSSNHCQATIDGDIWD